MINRRLRAKFEPDISKIERLVCVVTDRQTDGQTDGQTDRQTDMARSIPEVMLIIYVYISMGLPTLLR